MSGQSNIDDVRARIMELESAAVFDQRAWADVLIALTDRPNARADAARRMETVKQNAQWVGGVDVARGESQTVVCAVSAETDNKQRRVEQANQLIQIIASCGREFFSYLDGARGCHPKRHGGAHGGAYRSNEGGGMNCSDCNHPVDSHDDGRPCLCMMSREKILFPEQYGVLHEYLTGKSFDENKIRQLKAANGYLELKVERYEDALQEIDDWAKDYPLDVFPEPDLKLAHELLQAGGMTIDAVSASAMRFLLVRVQEIVKKAVNDEN